MQIYVHPFCCPFYGYFIIVIIFHFCDFYKVKCLPLDEKSSCILFPIMVSLQMQLNFFFHGKMFDKIEFMFPIQDQ